MEIGNRNCLPAGQAGKLEMRKAVEILKAGGVIVFPTETSYGIGCDATNTKAVRRVFAIKGRQEGKGTPLVVDSLKMAEQWGVFSGTAKKIAKKYWPGPLTIVVPARRILPLSEGESEGVRVKIVKSVLQNRTVALRVSSHPIASALAKGLGRPLVATSANRSGQPACYSVRAFLKSVGARHAVPDVIINAGTLPKRKPTTLVKVIGDKVEVFRQGQIKL